MPSGPSNRCFTLVTAWLRSPNALRISGASAASFIVRIVGFLKEALLAAIFGISAIIDTYVLMLIVATYFVNPIAGSISTLLTRKLPEILLTDTADAAQKLVFSCLTFAVICLAIFITMIGIWFGAGGTLLTLNPGVLDNVLTSEYFLLLVGLFASVTIVANGVLSAEKRFIRQSFFPATVSVCIIIACLLAPSNRKVEALVLGTIVGFMLEAGLATFSIRKMLRGWSIRRTLHPSPEFKDLLRLWIPTFASSLVMGGCVIVDQVMASLAGAGGVATISFGSRITLGLISVSAVLWLVLYPQFIELSLRGQFFALRKAFFRTVTTVLIVGLPICALMATGSEMITSVVFERGEFTASNTEIVSKVQIFYFLHIPFYIVVLMCMRILSVFEKANHILIGNLMTLMMSIGMNLLFIQTMGIVGIAAATLATYLLMALVWTAMGFSAIRNATLKDNQTTPV